MKLIISIVTYFIFGFNTNSLMCGIPFVFDTTGFACGIFFDFDTNGFVSGVYYIKLIKAIAVTASITGTARGTMQGSCLP